MYTVEISRRAQRDLRKLSEAAREQVVPVMQALARDPRPAGVRKLRGAESLWRVRAGDYRIIYEIESERVVVLVLRVRHRKDAYRDY